MKGVLGALAELLDWWRVHLAVLASLLASVLLLESSPDAPWADLASIGCVAAGLVAGLLWHAAAGRGR